MRKKKWGIRGHTRTTHIERDQASVNDASLFGFDGRLGSFHSEQDIRSQKDQRILKTVHLNPVLDTELSECTRAISKARATESVDTMLEISKLTNRSRNSQPHQPSPCLPRGVSC